MKYVFRASALNLISLHKNLLTYAPSSARNERTRVNKSLTSQSRMSDVQIDGQNLQITKYLNICEAKNQLKVPIFNIQLELIVSKIVSEKYKVYII